MDEPRRIVERDETTENGGAADGMMILGREKIDSKENFVSRNGETKKKRGGERRGGEETKRKGRRQGEKREK